MPEKTVQKEPGKKPAPSKKPKPQQEVVVQIPLSELHPFPDHPFQVREDASMQETAESVKEYGVLVPALARPREEKPAIALNSLRSGRMRTTALSPILWTLPRPFSASIPF